MLAIMSGNKIAIIATIQSSNKTNAVIVRKDKGIQAPKDLKGMRIGVPPGTVGNIFWTPSGCP
jgi:ABC-type nitrate/sulfonate/bicarbonate transport system substrate-binding protein